MKKQPRQPNGKELATILLSGLGMMSFGLLLIWIPIIGLPLLLIGAVFVLVFSVTIITILLQKVVK
jgi:hypothetical protein